MHGEAGRACAWTTLGPDNQQIFLLGHRESQVVFSKCLLSVCRESGGFLSSGESEEEQAPLLSNYCAVGMRLGTRGFIYIISFNLYRSIHYKKSVYVLTNRKYLFLIICMYVLGRGSGVVIIDAGLAIMELTM